MCESLFCVLPNFKEFVWQSRLKDTKNSSNTSNPEESNYSYFMIIINNKTMLNRKIQCSYNTPYSHVSLNYICLKEDFIGPIRELSG